MTRLLADELVKLKPRRNTMALTNSAAIQAFATAETATLNSLVTALNNIATGIAALDALITQLQNSAGTINPADQATLDAIQAQSQALVTQVKAINTTAPGAPVPVVPAPAKK
jgi:hypothetical protein